MPSCRRQVEIDTQLDGLPEKVRSGVSGDNSAATAKWRWTCSRVADAANSQTACRRVTDELVRVTPRVPHRSHTSINSLWPH